MAAGSRGRTPPSRRRQLSAAVASVHADSLTLEAPGNAQARYRGPALWILMLAVLVSLAGAAAAAQATRARVYVFTKPTVGGFVDEQLKLRTEAVRSAIDWMQKKYKRDVEIANSADAADVIVEVLDAPEDESARGYGESGKIQRVEGERQVIARLSVDEYSTKIFTQHKSITTAGKIVGQEVGKWVQTNKARLRPKPGA